MKIKLGQITKSSSVLKENVIQSKDGYLNLRRLTSINGHEKTSINLQRPMFWYKDFNNICPAIILSSNPHQKDKKRKPWNDIIDLNNNIVSYYGDNKTPGRDPIEKIKRLPQTGNNKLHSLINLYESGNEKDRSKAPPILIFQNCLIGKTKGYRKFIGLGLFKNHTLVSQSTDEGEQFLNYKYDFELVKLENDEFNWNWITERRTLNSDITEINKNAPNEWKNWIKKGEINKNRIYKQIQDKLGYEVESLLGKGIIMEPNGNYNPNYYNSSIIQYERNPQVKAWVLQNSKGKCECCLKQAPFITKKEFYYLEVHHVKQLSEGGSDTIYNTVALCPNCHKEAHYGKYNKQLIRKIYNQNSRLVKE